MGQRRRNRETERERERERESECCVCFAHTAPLPRLQASLLQASAERRLLWALETGFQGRRCISSSCSLSSPPPFACQRVPSDSNTLHQFRGIAMHCKYSGLGCLTTTFLLTLLLRLLAIFGHVHFSTQPLDRDGYRSRELPCPPPSGFLARLEDPK